jgi:ribosomal protein L24
MAKTTTTNLSVGDSVQVRPGKEHDAMTKGKKGTIVAISTPALGIKFEDMSMIHKWYTDSEVVKI